MIFNTKLPRHHIIWLHIFKVNKKISLLQKKKKHNAKRKKSYCISHNKVKQKTITDIERVKATIKENLRLV